MFPAPPNLVPSLVLLPSSQILSPESCAAKTKSLNSNFHAAAAGSAISAAPQGSGVICGIKVSYSQAAHVLCVSESRYQGFGSPFLPFQVLVSLPFPSVPSGVPVFRSCPVATSVPDGAAVGICQISQKGQLPAHLS